MILNYENINDLDRYKIMSGSIVPRPIAWIVTQDEGVKKCSTFFLFYTNFDKSSTSNCSNW